MGKAYLRNGTIIDLSEEQTIALAKAIMILPWHKMIKLNGVEFCVNDLDLEAKRIAELPQQGKLGIVTEVVRVEKKSRKQQKGIDFSN